MCAVHLAIFRNCPNIGPLCAKNSANPAIVSQLFPVTYVRVRLRGAIVYNFREISIAASFQNNYSLHNVWTFLGILMQGQTFLSYIISVLLCQQEFLQIVYIFIIKFITETCILIGKFGLELGYLIKLNIDKCVLIMTRISLKFDLLGTPIPKGLHVRHNFMTGVTEAKLMDDADEIKEDDETVNGSNSKSLTLHPDKSVLETEEADPVKIKKESESLKFPIDELKARLKKLKQEEADISNTNVSFIINI